MTAFAIACPSCGTEHTPAVQVTAESSRTASKRPVSPELIANCPRCGEMVILALHPALRKGITS